MRSNYRRVEQAGWREVPTDGSILGPAASSKEPLILQPFVVLREHYGDGGVCQNGAFDQKQFERQLYVLRKHATHTMFVDFPSVYYIEFMLNITLFIHFTKVRLPNGSTYAVCLRRI